MTAVHIINEVESAKAYFLLKEKDDPSTMLMAASFANSIVQQVNSCISIPIKDATMIIASLKDAPYSDDSTKKITAALDAKVLAHGPSGSNKKNTKLIATVREQNLKFWWHYCSQQDIDFFKDAKQSWHSKMTCLVERAMSLGVLNPDEHSIQLMLSMLVMLHYKEAVPSNTELFAKLHELKGVIQAERKQYPNHLQQLKSYPEKPQDMDPDAFAYAYGDSEPVTVSLPGVESLAKTKVACRSNSKLLKLEPKAPSATTAAASKMKLESVKQEHEQEHAPCSSFKGEDMPRDAVEQKLYADYKVELWKHRATLVLGHKHAKHAEDAPVVAATQHLRPKLELMPPKKEVPSWDWLNQHHGLRSVEPFDSLEDANEKALKDVQDAKDKALKALKMPEDDAPPEKVQKTIEKAKKGEDSDSDLSDEFAKAAIAGLGKRNTKRKAASAEAKREASSQAKLAKMRKPAAAKLEAVKVEKKVMPAAAKVEIVEVPVAKIVKAMPKDVADGCTNPAAVHYNGGVIYTVQKNKCFRALRTRGDKYTETTKSWGKKLKKSEAWKACVEAIDNQRKVKVKKATKSK